MSSLVKIHETCKCGAYISLLAEAPFHYIQEFHEQHKVCTNNYMGSPKLNDIVVPHLQLPDKAGPNPMEPRARSLDGKIHS